jgi:hypothetical protein
VQVVTEARDPSIRTGWRVPVVVGAIPALVIAGFALGPASAVVGVLVLVGVLAIVGSGSAINLRLYGTQKQPHALLHASAAVDGRSGTLDVSPGRLLWSPWKRYENSVESLDLSVGQVERAVVYARRGFPASARLQLLVRDSAPRNLIVFDSAAAVARALHDSE